jgi:3-hydroxyisobutyrate dehydrogenase-like beta-hydroxyacid dehydrogenase
MKQQIGFIGLGAMGSGMAANLLAKGWPLTVWAHRNQEAALKLVSAGARQSATPRALAEGCDIVLLCVTGSPQVEAVVKGPEGLAASGKPLLIVDCSTSDPSSTIRLARELEGRNITLIDAPLSRTPKDAAEGNLDVMVGGEEEAVARARPVIDCFAGRVVHTGPTGSGHAMKLLNNFVALGYAAIYSEALTLAGKAGLTPKVFDAVIRGGRMDCPFYQTFFKYVLERDRDAHKFALRNGLKDMNYLAAFALASDVANPLGAATRNSLATAIGLGRGEDYVPMLSDIIAGLNGVSLAPK